MARVDGAKNTPKCFLADIARSFWGGQRPESE